jgi:hypothetical protein
VQPEEVLELIGSAPERYDTVRAALRYRGDGPTIKDLRDRYLASEAHRLETGGTPETPGEVRHPEPDGPFGWRCRVWYAKVSPERGVRDRVELELPRGMYPDGGVYISAWDGRMVGPSGTDTAVDVRIGGGSREDDPLWLLLAQDSFWTTYLFDPDGIAGLPLHDLDLSVEGKTGKAGREAIRLVGVPVEEWDYFPEPLWWGADEYEFLVDSERGVLLRCASRLNGEDFDALEVEEIHFDERFPGEVFSSRQPLAWR